MMAFPVGNRGGGLRHHPVPVTPGEEAIYTWPLTNHIVPREVLITCIMRTGATNNQVTEAPNVLFMAPEE